MIEVVPVDFRVVSSLFLDFQKKSKYFDMPTDEAICLGIYRNKELQGYFIVSGYEDGTFLIEQGYLIPEARHHRLNHLAMKILQEQVKNAGYKEIMLRSTRSLRAYSEFMKDLGFKPKEIIFSKGVR